MIPRLMKNLLLVLIAYLFLTLRLKMVLNLIMIMKRKHGKEKEPWVHKSMPFPRKYLKTKEEEHYNKFCEWTKPLFLKIPLTDAIKLPPYSRYMKYIVTYKRKLPNEAISTLLANYSF